MGWRSSVPLVQSETREETFSVQEGVSGHGEQIRSK